MHRSLSLCFWMVIDALGCFVFLIGPEQQVAAKNYLVVDVPAFEKAIKSVQPGDNIILSEGEWQDARLIFRGKGTQSAPITLKASHPGKTVITGKSILRMHGDHLVVEGLLFQDPDPLVSDLINFRMDSDELCHNCRLTNCTVISTQQGNSSQESRWIGLHGSNNRIDHCNFVGKSGKGATFVVWLGNGSEGRHQIDHNYFGPREKLGKNGGETIRIGDSKTSRIEAACLVEKNLFEKCNGENECISNKSCGNIYRNNTFKEVSGTITLRHGNNCLVERNVFLGNKANGTGGVRIIGEDHVVRGNYFDKLTGDGARSALTLMTGIPNSPAHRYFQVKRAIVEDNVLIDCEHSLLIGLSDDNKASLPPEGTVIKGNIIHAPKYTAVESHCDLSGITWKYNHFHSEQLGIPPRDGIEMTQVDWEPLEPISRAKVGTTW